MRIIQMALDDDLVRSVDLVSKQLKTTRSAFIRKALREVLDRHHMEQFKKTPAGL
jgi:metal-responsive CopG/Arc/MetJ family transcriptional regulator